MKDLEGQIRNDGDSESEGLPGPNVDLRSDKVVGKVDSLITKMQVEMLTQGRL